MKRNPEAHCGNCPYFYAEGGRNSTDGDCRRHPIPEDIIHGAEYWCGEHPEFVLRDPAAPEHHHNYRSTD